MSALVTLSRIAIIIFVVEGLIMIGLSLIPAGLSLLAESLIDAVLLIALSSPLIYLWVVKPYAAERLEMVRKVEEMLGGGFGGGEEG